MLVLVGRILGGANSAIVGPANILLFSLSGVQIAKPGRFKDGST